MLPRATLGAEHDNAVASERSDGPDSRIFDSRPEDRGELNLAFNENPFAGPLGRYPDNRSEILLLRYMEAMRVVDEYPDSRLSVAHAFLSRGANDALDQVFRAIRPRIASAVICPPTFWEFERIAELNRISITRVPLDGADRSRLDIDGIVRSGADCVVLCNPGNPTGVEISAADLRELLAVYSGYVVVDETYVEFCPGASLAYAVPEYDHLIVIRSLSKAFGMASLRLGAIITAPHRIMALRRDTLPFMLPTPVVDAAVAALDGPLIAERLRRLISTRDRFAEELSRIPEVLRVHADAGFVSIQVIDRPRVLARLRSAGIAVSSGADNIRLSIGTDENNTRVINALSSAHDKQVQIKE